MHFDIEQLLPQVYAKTANEEVEITCIFKNMVEAGLEMFEFLAYDDIAAILQDVIQYVFESWPLNACFVLSDEGLTYAEDAQPDASTPFWRQQWQQYQQQLPSSEEEYDEEECGELIPMQWWHDVEELVMQYPQLQMEQLMQMAGHKDIPRDKCEFLINRALRLQRCDQE